MAPARCASTHVSSFPSLRPVFFSALIILAHIAIKSFDLVMALTGGGPGFSSDLPAIFMYTFAFNRNQIGLGAASAMMMLMTVVAVVVPMMYSETRRRHAPWLKFIAHKAPDRMRSGRVLVYALLMLFALYYLMPLFVMVTTSLKTLDEIRGGNLLALPTANHVRGLGQGLGERLHRASIATA